MMNCYPRQAFALFLYICIFITSTLSADTRPNIILIVADDLGWDDVGFHGSEIPTPNIDSLAYDGVILNNYYVQPICTPSRSALMTGRHPIHTGMQHSVIVGSQPYGLSLQEMLMPQYLKSMGYANHIVGKWHLGFVSKEYTPTHRGFDSHYGYYSGMEDYLDHTYCAHGEEKKEWGLDFWDDMDVVRTEFGQYSTELYTQRIERIIDKHNKSQPLFLYLPYQAVHSGNPITPLEAPYKYLQKVKHIKNKNRRLFGGMVSALDDSIGNVTRAVHSHGMLENSIIIFTTDNGGPAAGFDFNMACNWPLRGLKSLLWEGGVRGTGFIWSPKLKKSNYVASQMVTIYDWLPTLLRAAGFNMSKLPDNVDGVDQWETLSKDMPTRRQEILHNIDDIQRTAAIRRGNMKLIKGQSSRIWDGWYKPGEERLTDTLEKLDHQQNIHRMEQQIPEKVTTQKHEDAVTQKILRSLGREVSDGSPVLIKCGPKPVNATTNCKPEERPCLFDIETDPCEYNNLAEAQPRVVQALLQRLSEYNATAVLPRNKPEDPRGFPVYHNYTWVPWLNLTDMPPDSL